MAKHQGAAGPKEKLDSTVISQPAIYVASLAALEKLRQDSGEVSLLVKGTLEGQLCTWQRACLYCARASRPLAQLHLEATSLALLMTQLGLTLCAEAGGHQPG